MANNSPTCTLDELDALLGTDASDMTASPAWLRAACVLGDVHDLRGEELCELSAERDERGTSVTVAGLIEGLRVRHAGDRVTLAMLAALQDYHMPGLRDDARSG
jgi:hypothetical protein